MRKIVYFILVCFVILGLTTIQEQQDRFPIPTEKEIKEADKTVEQLAKDEVFSLPPTELAMFLWDILKKGRAEDFSYYDSNPTSLTEEQAKKPATILLHGYGTNQGEWLPLLKSASENNSGPIFTLQYPQQSSREDLVKRIEQIKELYLKAGQEATRIQLVGHSLGGITSADYAFDPDAWVPGTQVEKVISIAGRLRNVEPPSKTPYYAYGYMLLPYVDEVWQKIEQNRGKVRLYAIAAQEDWLLPFESVLVADNPENNIVIPDAGHALIGRKKEAIQQVLEWMNTP